MCDIRRAVIRNRLIETKAVAIAATAATAALQSYCEHDVQKLTAVTEHSLVSGPCLKKKDFKYRHQNQQTILVKISTNDTQIH